MSQNPDNNQKNTETHARIVIMQLLRAAGFENETATGPIYFERNRNIPNRYHIHLVNAGVDAHHLLAEVLDRYHFGDVSVSKVPLRVMIKSNEDPFARLASFGFEGDGENETFNKLAVDMRAITRAAAKINETSIKRPYPRKDEQDKWPAQGARLALCQALKPKNASLGDFRIEAINLPPDLNFYTLITLRGRALEHRKPLLMGLRETGFHVVKMEGEEENHTICLAGNVAERIAQILYSDGIKPLYSAKPMRDFQENVASHMMADGVLVGNWQQFLLKQSRPRGTPERA